MGEEARGSVGERKCCDVIFFFFFFFAVVNVVFGCP